METVREAAKQGDRKGGATRVSGSSPTLTPTHPLLALQQQAGNQAVQQLLRSGLLQAKLAISQPDEPEEREADQVADRVMRSHADFPASPCACAEDGEMCEECQQKQQGVTVARKPASAASPATSHSGIEHVLRSPGHPLDLGTRAFFEPRFGHDFSDVRVHTNAAAGESAQAINALAYTSGSNVVFAPGRYNPQASDGRSLLAHELAHTIQQRHGIVQRQPADQSSPDAQSSEAPAEQSSAPPQSLDERYQAALQDSRQTGNWQTTAELLNGFNRVDIEARLAQLSPDEISSLHNGAVDNPRVGPQSQVAQMTAPGTPPASTPEPAVTPAGPAPPSGPQPAAPEPGPPQLVQSFRGWVAEGNWPEAAETLNGFNETDIHTLLSSCTAEQIASIHQGALDNPRVGPDSQVARLTASSTPSPGPDSDCPDKPVPEMTKTEKLYCAIEFARQGRDAAMARQLEALRTPQAIFAMIALAALYIGAQLTPVGWIADAFLLAAVTISAFFVGTVIIQALKDLATFVNAINATTQDELKESGEALADAVALAGITLILALLTHAGREVPPGRTPFTAPEAEGSRVGVTPDGQLVRVPEETPQPETKPPALYKIATLDESMAKYARPAEQLAAKRLAAAYPEFNGRTFKAPPPPDPGYDWTDDLGRHYDAMGDGTKSAYFDFEQFKKSIVKHLNKGNDFTVIDMTGYTADQIKAVTEYYNNDLTQAQRDMIRRIGF